MDAISMMSTMMIFGLFFGLAVFAAWIWALVDILRSTFSDSIIKVLWFLLVFCLPLLGFILYIVIGKSTKTPDVIEVSTQKYDNLEKIKKLYDNGVLNDAEYESEKSKLLNS
jgi:hypothetical protein